MSARRLFVGVMGTWMGMAGIEHGIGEILQGSVVPQGVLILSWPDSPFFRSLNGEPAMTLVPDMRLTGILAVTFSLLYVLTAIFFAGRRHGGVMMMLLAVPMLLFGGGLFPPVMGGLIGLAATRLQIRAPVQPAGALRQFFGRSWYGFFAALIAAWLMLLPGVAVLDYFYGIESSGLTLGIMAAAFILLYLSYWSAVQHDNLIPTS
jgi:hypothetical protein